VLQTNLLLLLGSHFSTVAASQNAKTVDHSKLLSKGATAIAVCSADVRGSSKDVDGSLANVYGSFVNIEFRVEASKIKIKTGWQNYGGKTWPGCPSSPGFSFPCF